MNEQLQPGEVPETEELLFNKILNDERENTAPTSL